MPTAFPVSAFVDNFMRSADQAAMQAAIGLSPISSPQIIYVASSGNDGTAEIGNPAKPFASLQAAYDTGVSTSANFVIELGFGLFTLSLSSDFSSLCLQINGQGFNSSGSATSVSITNSPGYIENGNGSPGPNIAILINNLFLAVTISGQNVTASDSLSYTAGDGGAISVTGFGSVNISSSGGGNQASSDGSVTGGNGGTITVSGSIQAYAGLISAGGSGFNAANGSDGLINLDGVDLRNALSVQTSALTLGRCSYTSGLTIANDKGGNAAW